MGSETGKSKKLAHLFGRLRSGLQFAGGGPLIGVVFVVVAVVGVYWAWGRWGSLATQHARFQLSAGSIDIPPQPQWIQADVRAEVFRDANWDC